MNPLTRLSWTLGCTLILWLPAAYGVIGGSTDITIGGIYFLGALLLSYLGTGIVSSIWTGYRRSTDEALARAKREIIEIERRNAAEERRKASESNKDD